MPEAPTGGLTYGRLNGTTWTGVLPLTGGTISPPPLSGTTSDSAMFITSTAVGSGVNGPATGQFGLSIDHQKVGWYDGTAAMGEIDGLVIQARQGGTLSDCGGMLINVAGTGNGFLAIDESVVQRITPNTGVVQYSIRTQEGALGGARVGKVLIADQGNLTAAVLAQNTSGQGYWGKFLSNAKDGAENYYVDDSGNTYAPAATATFLNVHVGTGNSVYLRADTAIGINYDSATNGIQFNLGANSAEVLASGGLTIFGTKVIGTQITGWGNSTGGARGLITASSTLPQVAAALAQLLTDLQTHGLIAP